MNWQKIWLVMRREYLFNFRRPAFLFTAFGVPLISLGAMFLITTLIVQRESNLDDWQRVAYLDRAGAIDPAAAIPETCDCDFAPVSDPDLVRPDDPAALPAYYDAQQAAATEQVRSGQLDGFFVLTDYYVFTGQVDLYSERNIPEALRDNIESFLWHQVAARAPDDLAVPVDRLNDQEFTLRDLDTGDELTEAALIGRMMLPFVFVFVYVMATNTTAQFLMSGVVDEKENRLMEILATSLRPLELLWGKLAGLGSLALTQVALWMVGGAMIIAINEDAREFLSGATFQAGDVVLIVILFLCNFFLFAAAMLGIGASVTAETESRQIAGFLTFICMLPIVVGITFFTNPNGPIPVFFSFFPPTAATALVMRLGLTTLPVWQIALSMAIQVTSVIAVMWLAAKAFRLGMLMYGKPLGPRTLWRALREGRTALTTAREDA